MHSHIMNIMWLLVVKKVISTKSEIKKASKQTALTWLCVKKSIHGYNVSVIGSCGSIIELLSRNNSIA